MKTKEVKKKTSNKLFYFTLLNLIKEGKSPSDISKQLNISNQKIYYYTRELRKLGFIKKISYGKWEVVRSKKIDLEHTLNWKDKKIRGHAFIWKVKSERKYDWKIVLERNNINYKLIRGLIPRVFINNKKVWLGKETITIYESKSFYGKNAIESRKYAVYELQKTMDELQRKLKIKFKYFFKPVREHYGIIKNELAQQLNKNGEKLIVRDDLDGEWLWIDDSSGMFGELETGGKGFTKDRAYLNMQVQKYYNSNKKHDFKVDADYILNGFNQLTEIQKREAEKMEEYAEELRSHKDAIKMNAKQMGEFVILVRELKEILKDKKSKL